MVTADNEENQAGTIWALNLDEVTPVITPLISAAFSRLRPESAPALAAAMGDGALEEVYQRFATGRNCYAAWVEGQMAAYGWVSFVEESIGELGLNLTLLPGEAYIWDCATLPAFRQKRLFSALLGFTLKELRLEPLCRVWIGADLDNAASQRAIDRAGFHRVADLGVRRVSRVSNRHEIWVRGYPGIPENLVAEAQRTFVGDRNRGWRVTLSLAKFDPASS